jgi:SAM-dependent methyltransferase
VLDLGCNDGAFTMELAHRVGATEVHGVEFPEPWRAKRRREACKSRPMISSRALPYESAHFGVVHSNQVIEHLVHTDTFLKEIRRVLKPSGYALISTNNLASWHNVFSLVLGMQPPPCHVSDERIVGNPLDPHNGDERPEKGVTHLRIFSYQGLADLLRLHGFRAEAFVTSGYYPAPPSLARVLCRIDPRHGAFLIARARPGATDGLSVRAAPAPPG